MFFHLILMFLLGMILVSSPVYCDNNNNEIIYNVVIKSSIDMITTIKVHIPGYPRETYSASHIEIETRREIIFGDKGIEENTITSCTGGWIKTISDSSIVTRTLSPNSEYCRTIKGRKEYIDIEDFYKSTFTSISYLEKFEKIIRSRFGENLTFNLSTYYKGVSYHNDMPLIVFIVQGNITGSHEKLGIINGFINGIIYNHMGLLIPVKGKIIYSISSYTLEQEINMTLKLEFDMKEGNLPHTASYNYADLGDVEISVGGLPGSNIKVVVKGGLNKIEVFNYGENYGYVMINLKTLTYKALDNSTNTTIVNAFLVYGIEPHSNRSINTHILFNRDVEITTQEYSGRQFSTLEIMVFIIIAIIIIGIIWLIKK